MASRNLKANSHVLFRSFYTSEVMSRAPKKDEQQQAMKKVAESRMRAHKDDIELERRRAEERRQEKRYFVAKTSRRGFV